MSEIFDLSRTLGERLLARGWLLATAESCTGGGIACAVTDIAGSSAWFDRGFVTYSNAAKQDMLGVPAATLAAHGAVSEATARAMASGALARSAAGVAVAVTGVAGPSGGSPAKPVGTVWFAYALAGSAVHARLHRYDGDRAAVRARTVERALGDLIRLADGLDPE
ncbi:MAG TPA: nicotinamide-nucleotide amidohydrolase family protein [Gammaproteobacteria bacterium]|nr:nicotinamide-nucleotide amidohydrolase family protein [Gammaproteobacteria bacterium]